MTEPHPHSVEKLNEVFDSMETEVLSLVKNAHPGENHRFLYFKIEPFACEQCPFVCGLHDDFYNHLVESHYEISKERLESFHRQELPCPDVMDEFERVRDRRTGHVFKPLFDNNEICLKMPRFHPLEEYILQGMEFTQEKLNGPSFKIDSGATLYAAMEPYKEVVEQVIETEEPKREGPVEGATRRATPSRAVVPAYFPLYNKEYKDDEETELYGDDDYPDRDEPLQL